MEKKREKDISKVRARQTICLLHIAAKMLKSLIASGEFGVQENLEWNCIFSVLCLYFPTQHFLISFLDSFVGQECCSRRKYRGGATLVLNLGNLVKVQVLVQ